MSGALEVIILNVSKAPPNDTSPNIIASIFAKTLFI